MKKLLLFLILLIPIFAKYIFIQKLFQWRVYDTNKKAPILVGAYIVDNNTSIKKRPSFHYDPNVSTKYQTGSRCYYKSGYDRGHLIADRWMDFNKTVLYYTYDYTNIVPEIPHDNRVIIKAIEGEIDRMKCGYKIVQIRIFYSNKRIKPNCGFIPNKLIYEVICDDKLTTFKIKLSKKGSK